MQVEEENRLLEIELQDKISATTRTHERVQELLDKVDSVSLFLALCCMCADMILGPGWMEEIAT